MLGFFKCKYIHGSIACALIQLLEISGWPIFTEIMHSLITICNELSNFKANCSLGLGMKRVFFSDFLFIAIFRTYMLFVSKDRDDIITLTTTSLLFLLLLPSFPLIYYVPGFMLSTIHTTLWNRLYLHFPDETMRGWYTQHCLVLCCPVW